jgi:hypothetical protein
VITTTTSAVYGGITDNVPRLDYTDSSCPALLLEPLRSNLWSYSEYVSGNPLVSLPIITENYVVSPEGVSNAFRIQDTTGGSFKRISISSSGLSVSANSTYTQSLFVKKATSAITNYGGIGFDYTGGTTRKIAYVVFDEYNGTLAELTSGFPLNTTLHPVEDYGDYWRFSVSTTDNGSNTNLSMNIYACLSTNGTSAGTGTKDWTGYGLQLEQGSYATSYIPTYGSSVSRVVDDTTIANLQSKNIVGNTFSYYFEWGDYVANRNFEMKDSSSFNFLFMVSRLIRYIKQDGSVDSLCSLPANGTSLKSLISYDGTTLKGYINGSLAGSVTNAKVDSFSDFNKLRLDRSMDDREELKQVMLFPTALTDQEAIDLTTI